MVNLTRCSILGGHCRHWGLTDEEHAATHAVVLLINLVAETDAAAGRPLDGSGSETSIAGDGRRLVALLEAEGYRLVPKAGR